MLNMWKIFRYKRLIKQYQQGWVGYDLGLGDEGDLTPPPRLRNQNIFNPQHQDPCSYSRGSRPLAPKIKKQKKSNEGKSSEFGKNQDFIFLKWFLHHFGTPILQLELPSMQLEPLSFLQEHLPLIRPLYLQLEPLSLVGTDLSSWNPIFVIV